jgi:hypothetical protein
MMGTPKGFEYIESKFFPMIEVKLNGRTLSIKELAKIAEQMRVKLLEHGIEIGFKND